MLRAIRVMIVLSLSLLVCLAETPRAAAQSSGSRGGLPNGATRGRDFPPLDQEIVQRYIMIEGSSEVRVRPTEIRVVLAVTNEAETAQECQAGIQNVIRRLKESWSDIQVPAKDVVVDFISVLPRYEWKFEKIDEQEVATERKVGYRMQTNVHLAVREESVAQLAVAKAFEQGVTDIIAFDYWSADVDNAKVQAREQAVEAASRKAKALLFTLVDKSLPVINVQEQTEVLSPETLYHSFVNSYEDTVESPTRRDVPRVHAYRPRNTYYHGPQVEVDTQSHELPMNPEISVIARVRLYFKSPEAKSPEAQDADKEQ